MIRGTHPIPKRSTESKAVSATMSSENRMADLKSGLRSPTTRPRGTSPPFSRNGSCSSSYAAKPVRITRKWSRRVKCRSRAISHRFADYRVACRGGVFGVGCRWTKTDVSVSQAEFRPLLATISAARPTWQQHHREMDRVANRSDIDCLSGMTACRSCAATQIGQAGRDRHGQ